MNMNVTQASEGCNEHAFQCERSVGCIDSCHDGNLLGAYLLFAFCLALDGMVCWYGMLWRCFSCSSEVMSCHTCQVVVLTSPLSSTHLLIHRAKVY